MQVQVFAVAVGEEVYHFGDEQERAIWFRDNLKMLAPHATVELLSGVIELDRRNAGLIRRQQYDSNN